MVVDHQSGDILAGREPPFGTTTAANVGTEFLAAALNHDQGNFEPKDTPSAGLTLDKNFPAHGVNKSLTDGEAESGAALLCATLCLAKGFENCNQILVIDPDAGVRNFKAKASLFASNRHADAAAFGEFDGVT